MMTVEPSKSMPRIYAVLLAVVMTVAALFLLLAKIGRNPASEMSFSWESEPSALTVLESGRKVLSYVYGDRLPAGVDSRYARSSYIHPLHALDGRVLTEDFPRDHLHHHGLFWAWPVVEVRGVTTSNWEPAEPPLRQLFARWVRQEADRGEARLVVENAWTLGGTEVVVQETVTIIARPATTQGRAIDIEIVLRPVGGPIALRGTPADMKGYSGLCFRGAAADGQGQDVFKGAAMTTDEGPLAADSTGRAFRWADLSTPAAGGVAIFVSPDHPGFPLPWLIRNSYAGILNPCWPGLPGTTLAADTPVTLGYRIYVHDGDAGSGRVREAYEAYIAARGRGL